MKLFNNNPQDKTNYDIIFANLPKEQKEELLKFQELEYNNAFADTLTIEGMTTEMADQLANEAVELMTGKYFLDHAVENPVPPVTPAQPPADASDLPPLPPSQPEAKKKYTFEFEVYEGGAFKRTASVSTLEENKVAAYPIAEAALKAELTGKETFRYTGIYKKENVTVENI